MKTFTEEEQQEIADFKEFLKRNKVTFDQFIRVNNYLQDMKKENPGKMNLFIDAYQEGMFTAVGFY